MIVQHFLCKLINCYLGQYFFVPVPPARILIGFFNERLNGVHSIANYRCRGSKGSTNKFIIDHQRPEVITFNEFFHDHRPVIFFGCFKCLNGLVVSSNVRCVSFAMITVDRLNYQWISKSPDRIIQAFICSNYRPPGNGNLSGIQQHFCFLFVARNVYGDI